MAESFGSLVFTPVVKELQERYGSRRQYKRLTAKRPSQERPRFTVEEIRTILAPFEERLQSLERDNTRLRAQLARQSSAS